MKPVQIPLKPVIESAIDQNGVGAVVDMLRAICEERSGITHGKYFLNTQTRRFYGNTIKLLETTRDQINSLDPNNEANWPFVQVITPNDSCFIGPFLSGPIAGGWAERRKKRNPSHDYYVMTGREMRQNMAEHGECPIQKP